MDCKQQPTCALQLLQSLLTAPVALLACTSSWLCQFACTSALTG